MNLLSKDLTEGSTEDCEVLREQEDLSAVNGAPTGDYAVSVGTLSEATLMRPVAGQHVQFVEGTRVEQVVNPFSGQHLPFVVLALDSPFRTGMDRRLPSLIQPN